MGARWECFLNYSDWSIVYRSRICFQIHKNIIRFRAGSQVLRSLPFFVLSKYLKHFLQAKLTIYLYLAILYFFAVLNLSKDNYKF
jgi:hypothetical protein